VAFYARAPNPSNLAAPYAPDPPRAPRIRLPRADSATRSPNLPRVRRIRLPCAEPATFVRFCGPARGRRGLLSLSSPAPPHRIPSYFSARRVTAKADELFEMV